MKIIMKKPCEIIPYENNPRHNDDAVAAVAESIRQFGFKVPIIIDMNNVVVAGHTRLKAANHLSLSAVPCVIADDLTPEQISAFRIIDNHTASLSSWDYAKLEQELTGIQSIDMSQFNMDIDIHITKPVDDDNCEIFLPETPKAEQGQLFKLGRHRLLCGDATSRKDIDRLMGGMKADLLITDPPYNVNYTGCTAAELTMNNDNLSSTEYQEFLTSAFTFASLNMNFGAAFYIWYADSEAELVRAACRFAALECHQTLIWVKSHLVQSWSDYQWQHEPCLYGWKSGAKHNWMSDRKQTTVLHFDKPNRNEEHPTMKPVPLFGYQIQNNTRAGDIVLDIFGGSGTALIACEETDRVCYMCDNDPRYIDVIIKRWETLTGKLAQLITI